MQQLNIISKMIRSKVVVDPVFCSMAKLDFYLFDENFDF